MKTYYFQNIIKIILFLIVSLFFLINCSSEETYVPTNPILSGVEKITPDPALSGGGIAESGQFTYTVPNAVTDVTIILVPSATESIEVSGHDILNASYLGNSTFNPNNQTMSTSSVSASDLYTYTLSTNSFSPSAYGLTASSPIIYKWAVIGYTSDGVIYAASPEFTTTITWE
ncbi:MAG: hypothetical protein GY754_40320 [bacterium]|nr:hypothetical protein [bacterium]